MTAESSVFSQPDLNHSAAGSFVDHNGELIDRAIDDLLCQIRATRSCVPSYFVPHWPVCLLMISFPPVSSGCVKSGKSRPEVKAASEVESLGSR